MSRKVQKLSRLPSSSKTSSQKKLNFSEAMGRIQGLESAMSQVLRDMKEKMRQLECLNEFSSLMSSSLDTDFVRDKALEATCKLLGCEVASVLFVDRQKGELRVETPPSTRFSPGQKNVRLPIDDQSIPGYVAMTGESVVVNDLARNSKPSGVSEVFGKSFQKKAMTMVCVPLKSKDQTIGVLQALNKLPSLPLRSSQHPWPDFYEADRKLLETLSHSVAIAIENSQLYTQIKRNFFETVESLAEAIEKKDRYTGGHTKRVVYYSVCIAKYMDISQDQMEQIRLAAILHDVGKIGIEDSILKKQAPLTAEEWKVMQTHPMLGYEIIGRVEGLKDVIGGVRFHHERWDGKGYPLGLKAEEIPLSARIIAVADTFDAMVSTRPYRKGMDPMIAYREILRYKGTQFDPGVVDAFVEAFQKEKMGKGSGGATIHPPKGQKLSNCD